MDNPTDSPVTGTGAAGDLPAKLASFGGGVHSRGLVYFTIPIITILGEKFTSWTSEPPRNGWEFASVICAALVAGLTAVRAYQDQHISNTKNK